MRPTTSAVACCGLHCKALASRTRGCLRTAEWRKYGLRRRATPTRDDFMSVLLALVAVSREMGPALLIISAASILLASVAARGWQ